MRKIDSYNKRAERAATELATMIEESSGLIIEPYTLYRAIHDMYYTNNRRDVNLLMGELAKIAAENAYEEKAFNG